jgi:hypothetical protein
MDKNTPKLSTVERITVGLEALLSLGALWGGTSLVARPDGSLMQLQLARLAHTPFSDYLIPGLVLLAVNGLFPLVVIGLVLRRHAWSARLTVLSGVLLAGWIAAQIALIRLFHPPLHVPYLTLGVALAALGAVEEGRRPQPRLTPSPGSPAASR